MSTEQQPDLSQVPMCTHRDGANAAQNAIAEYREQVSQMEDQRSEIRAGLAEAKGSLGDLYGNLAVAVLPDSTEETVAAAASQLGCPVLGETLRHQKFARRSEIDALEVSRDAGLEFSQTALTNDRRRLEEIEADQTYQDRQELIDPTAGLWSVRLAEASDALTARSLRRDAYANDPDFMACYRRKDARPANWLVRLLCAILLISFFRRRREAAVVSRFGAASLGECFSAYESAEADCLTLQQAVEFQAGRIDDLKALIDEHDALIQTIADTERQIADLQAGTDPDSLRRQLLLTELDDDHGAILEAVRQEAVRFLSACEAFDQIHRNVGPEAKIAAASILAQKAKLPYLRRMHDHLSDQIDDRLSQIRKLDKVRRIWSRRPYNYLRGGQAKADKLRGWMVGLPQAKRRSTGKTVTLIRPMYVNTFGFTDYLMYSYLLDSCGYGHFLPLDVFGRCGDERMPYDGFCQNVCPEVGEYRQEYGDKPDFAPIDGAYKEANATDAADADDLTADAAADAYGSETDWGESGAALDADSGSETDWGDSDDVSDAGSDSSFDDVS